MQACVDTAVALGFQQAQSWNKASRQLMCFRRTLFVTQAYGCSCVTPSCRWALGVAAGRYCMPLKMIMYSSEDETVYL
jgi:hypothetical protein